MRVSYSNGHLTSLLVAARCGLRAATAELAHCQLYLRIGIFSEAKICVYIYRTLCGFASRSCRATPTNCMSLWWEPVNDCVCVVQKGLFEHFFVVSI